jgi:diguanylate cyclase (GGDEF)-like protein/PAS domain S-box-containing protein
MTEPDASDSPDPRPRPQRFRRALKRVRQLLSGGEGAVDASESLRTTVAILKAQQDATLDGILVVDLAGEVLSLNRRFIDIWGIPHEVARTSTDNELLQYAAKQVTDRDSFIREISYIYEHPDEVRTGDIIPLKDSRVLSRASVPVVTDGRITGRAWYFRDMSEQRKSEKLHSALFRIAELTRSARSLDDLYPAIHQIVCELMDARNFYIALYDEQKNMLSFPYFVDEMDARMDAMPPGRGLTGYVLRTGEALLVNETEFAEMVARGEVATIGAPSVDWLGVPLKTGDRTWGVLGTQTYHESRRYGETEKEILQFVSQQVATAIEQVRKDDAVRTSERRYRQMFENNRAVQILIDPATGHLLDANAAAAEFYGYTVEQLCKMTIWDINMLGEQELREEMLQTESQNRSYFMFRHRLASGEVRDVEVHSGPVELGGKRVLYSIIHDISERKRAESALLRSEEKYRNIFDFAPVGIYQSTRSGRIVTVNATLARMLGYDSVEELLGRKMSDVYFRPEEREEVIHRFGVSGYAADWEVRWRRKDGTPLWIQLNAHSVGATGNEILYEGFVSDITERKKAAESVASANAQRKAVLEAATRVSIIATDAVGLITVFNAGAERLLGYSSDEMIGRQNIRSVHVPEELDGHAQRLSAELGRPVQGLEALIKRAALRGVEEGEWSYVSRSGARLTVQLSVTALRSEDGSITGYLHVANDLTERKRAEETLRTQSAAMTASMDGIAILTENAELSYLNDALATLYGYHSPDLLVGRSWSVLFEPAEFERVTTTILPGVKKDGRWRGEAVGLRRDGGTFPQEISLTAIDRGGMVCVARDITERTYAEEQIKHLAYHDALSGLPNRLLFKDRLTVAISRAQRDKTRLAVLFLDLDRFKVINDSLGHNVGDQLLQSVAWRVQSCLRDSDTVARLGGDEFTLLLPHLIHSEDAARVAEKLLEAIRNPITIEGREFFITTSIGISLFPEDGNDAETLIKNADTAMYQAKEQGRDNYQLFNAFVNAKALQRITLEHGLRKALASQELVIYYQPIFDLRLSRITGMEALLRWNHPEFGIVPPADFIPLAETAGLMVPIGLWVLRTACMHVKSWHDRGYKNLSLAVNLSVSQLQHPDLVERVGHVLAETGMPARLLELEITESSAMHNPENSIRTLYDLKKLGLRISLDDFGTGHSSLSYLKRFPIDTLKIDQSYVRDITTDPDTAAIVSAIIAMTHSLRLKVIAEGVEFADQAQLLKRYSCDQMQGFLIKEPVPAEEFERILLEAGQTMVPRAVPEG